MPRLAAAGHLAGLRRPDGAGPARPPRCASEIRRRDRAPARSLRDRAATSRPTTSTGTSTCMCCRASEARCSKTVAAALPGTAAADARSDGPAGGHRRPRAWPGQRPCRSRLLAARLCGRGAQGAGCRPTTASPASPTSTSSAPYAEELQQRAAAAGPAAPRHVPSGPSRCRARRPRSRRRPAAHGVRRAHARSGPAPAHLAASRSADGPTLDWPRAAGLSDGASRSNRPAPGGQHPLRHGLAFLVSGGSRSPSTRSC